MQLGKGAARRAHRMLLALVRKLLAAALIIMAANVLPAKANEPRQILVIGDSLSLGLGMGLGVCFQHMPEVKVVTKGKISTGLTTKRPIDWAQEAQRLSMAHPYAAVVIQIGANDIMPIWADGAQAFGSPRWKQEYAAKVTRITQAFAARGAKVFWVGLPQVRRADYAQAYAQINAVARDAIGDGPAQFHDIWTAFQQDGAFTSYGKDISGKTVIIRAEDGTHFTPNGYVKEASLIAPEIAAELGLAATACHP